MDMSHYRELFLSETREHIDNLNTLVVVLEQQPGDRETIDALFREAHSIKGMAATMGYERTAGLAHHLEDLLDGFRNGGALPVATVDYLLQGIDLLDGLLDDLQNNQPERGVDAFMAAATAAQAATSLTTEEAGDDELPLLAVEPEAEPDAEQAGDPEAERQAEPLATEPEVFQVMINLHEDTPASAARGILILRELERAGEVNSSTPDLETLRGGAPCQRIKAWIKTGHGKPHLEEMLRQISGVSAVRFSDDRRREDRRGRDEGRTVRVRAELLDQFVNLTGELLTQHYMLHSASQRRDRDALEQSLVMTGRLLDDLHHHVLQARLMPLENITGRLPRIVRDLSRQSGKKVTLNLSGTEVGIDRVVLEALSDPLVHLVRNAVDHGVADEGVVSVSARREKELVIVEVADDGVGMDPALLRSKAVEGGLLTRLQADGLSDRDALMLICRPGFSTAETVTETSGRGVGMDVVKAAVTDLGGTLEVLSAAGEGTRFQLRLPLSIAIIKILLVRCSGRTMAIPVSRVQRTLDLPSDEIAGTAEGGVADRRRTFRLDEEDVPLYSLAAIMGLPQVAAGEITWVVLSEFRGRRFGLEVDRFLGQRDAFVKSLGFPLGLLPGLSGATIEGDGRIIFIIDPQGLLEGRPVDTQNRGEGADAISRTG
jgi:two-component system chemotaxis sensor kinase CheA